MSTTQAYAYGDEDGEYDDNNYYDDDNYNNDCTNCYSDGTTTDDTFHNTMDEVIVTPDGGGNDNSNDYYGGIPYPDYIPSDNSEEPLPDPEDNKTTEDPKPDDKQPDPCNEQTKSEAANATKVLSEIPPQPWMTTIPKDSIEHMFALEQTWVPPAGNELFGHYAYSIPEVTNGTSNNSSTTIDRNTIAIGHNHPADSYSAPSAADLYSLLDDVGGYPNLTLSFIFAANGSKYALQVSDPAAAAAFLNQYPENANLNKLTNGFLEGSVLGQKYQDIYSFCRYGEKLGDQEANEQALVQIISQTGLSIQKADPGSNQFYTLVPEDKCTQTNDVLYSNTKCN